jgi:hypothetical protein
MLTAQGSGGEYAGFRYATVGEVETLFINAGVPDVNGSSAANVVPAQVLIGLMGATKNFRGVTEIFGITGSTNPDGVDAGVIDHSYNGGVAFYDVSVTSITYGVDYSDVSIGNWLVADVTEVPVPAAWLLFTSALGVLVFSTRQSRR